MSTLSPSAIDAFTRLLRVLSLLTAQLDPVKGIKATTLRGFAEDIEDIGKEHGTSLDATVRKLLSKAASSVTLDVPLVPYAVCISVHLALSQVLDALVQAGPAAESAFSRLAPELVDEIVAYCQDDDFRLRQNTNLALSRTCRAFNRSTSPILAAEMHLFTPGQLERVGVRLTERTLGLSRLRVVTTDLRWEEIRWQSSQDWPGRQLGRLLRFLHHCEPPGLRTLELTHARIAEGSAIFTNPLRRTHFQIADFHFPRKVDVARLTSSAAFDEHFRLDSYHSLVIPHFLFTPTLLLQMVKPGGFSTLSRLELALELAAPASAAPLLLCFFTHLAPTLTRLALRIRCPYIASPPSAVRPYEDAICNAVLACQNLRHVELGGRNMTEPAKTAKVAQIMRRLPKQMRNVKVILPDELATGSWDEMQLCFCVEACEGQGVLFSTEARQAEYTWFTAA